MPLFTRPSSKRSGGTWDDDDYDVANEHGDTVGRIYRTDSGPAEMQWRWFINGVHLAGLVPDLGYAPTLDEAKAALAKQWRRWLEIKGLPEDYRPEV
jgi:hypothetical protein